ncbi:MAG: glycine cleavage system aminomethyltransferase GcvT [Planctomycetota bacterium]
MSSEASTESTQPDASAESQTAGEATGTGGPQRTALYDWHQANGGRLVEFAGYEMPIQYSTIVAEHASTRTQAGIFDISHMGRLRFEGNRAHELLDHVLTRRVDNISVGQVRYSLICNESGGILDDVLLSNLESPSSRQFFLLVVNASNREKIVKWLQPHLADYPDVAFNDVTNATTMISVQGPGAESIIEKLFSPAVAQIGYYRSVVTDQMSKPCIVSRTGYTGEDGYELVIRNEDAARVWENVMLAGRAGGILPVGLGARDTLRLEAGMPLYGHELSEEIDPLTAGLGFAVNLKDRSFIGSDALQKIKQTPKDVARVGLRLTGRRPAREGATLVDRDNRTVGEVTSGTFSPTLQSPIAMAYIQRSMAVVGQTIDIDIRGSKSEGEIVDLPFYKRTK